MSSHGEYTQMWEKFKNMSQMSSRKKYFYYKLNQQQYFSFFFAFGKVSKKVDWAKSTQKYFTVHFQLLFGSEVRGGQNVALGHSKWNYQKNRTHNNKLTNNSFNFQVMLSKSLNYSHFSNQK